VLGVRLAACISLKKRRVKMESVGKNGEGQQIILQSFTGGGVMVGKEIENARGSEDRFV